jgi:hypothetical protein
MLYNTAIAWQFFHAAKIENPGITAGVFYKSAHKFYKGNLKSWQ